jgi:hypothetical protein
MHSRYRQRASRDVVHARARIEEDLRSPQDDDVRTRRLDRELLDDGRTVGVDAHIVGNEHR